MERRHVKGFEDNTIKDAVLWLIYKVNSIFTGLYKMTPNVPQK